MPKDFDPNKNMYLIIDNGKRRFNRIDNSEEWYILELNENLSTYGVNGKYNEMNKLN